jgi:prophage antirepressor-like protein
MSIIPFNYGNKAIRVVKDEVSGESYFVAKDAAELLGYKDTNSAIKQHCRGVAKYHPLTTGGGTQDVRVITEPNLWRLIIASKLPQAQKIESWVFEQVLPAIRKNGSYIDPELKQEMEKFIPKSGFLEENAKGEIKTKSVRGYYRVDKNSHYGQLLTRKHQLQKRLNGFFIEEIKFELAEIEGEITELTEGGAE